MTKVETEMRAVLCERFALCRRQWERAERINADGRAVQARRLQTMGEAKALPGAGGVVPGLRLGPLAWSSL